MSSASMTIKPKKLEIPRTRPKQTEVEPDTVKTADNPTIETTSPSPKDDKFFEGPAQVPMIPDTSNELTPRPHKKRQMPPQRSTDPAKAREMIAKGVSRIQAKAVDAFGYRKLRNLASDPQVFSADDMLFDSLLLALLEELESAPMLVGSDYGPSVIDVKIQILTSVRHILEDYKKYSETYYPRAMTALIATRKHYATDKSTVYLVNSIEELALDIVGACNPPYVIDAILDLLETEEDPSPNNQTLIFGMFVLTMLLKRYNVRGLTVPYDEINRLSQFAKKHLRKESLDVHKVMIAYCVQLHGLFDSPDDFWRSIATSTEDYKSLLAYYVTV